MVGPFVICICGRMAHFPFSRIRSLLPHISLPLPLPLPLPLARTTAQLSVSVVDRKLQAAVDDRRGVSGHENPQAVEANTPLISSFQMNFEFHRYIPWFGSHPNKDISSPITYTTTLSEAPKEKRNEYSIWKWSVLAFIPWAMRATDKIQLPTTVNKGLKKRGQPQTSIKSFSEYSNIRFRPYVSRVPWHTGPRGFLSQLFPRYGNYCGPNWSSGKDSGSPIWDKRPIDWLDFCCYCHDIGYDTHDQAELLKADLAFLDCLERPNMSTKGDPQVAYVYKFMCTSGLRNVLIPYRQQLVKLQSGKLLLPPMWLSNIKWNEWKPSKT